MTRGQSSACLAALLLVSSGCSSRDGVVSDAAPVADLATAANPVIARPYALHVPSGYDASQPTPLLVMLHGYGATGEKEEAYLLLTPLADQQTFFYATPDGTPDSLGYRSWNATDACCSLAAEPVDDVAYIGALIDDVSAQYNIDARRIFLVGHSNGGFMAHRLACDLSSRISGIVSLAGMTWKDPSKCPAKTHVAVLQVNGDADAVVAYNGGHVRGVPQLAHLPPFPSARDTIAFWAGVDACPTMADSDALDLDAGLSGAETEVLRYGGCGGGAAELWTIKGGGHIPNLQASFPSLIYAFLSAHPRP